MKERYNIITKEILSALAVASIIIIASTSPYFLINIARAIIKNRKYSKSRTNEQKIVGSLRRLKNNNLINIKEKDNGKFIIRLTERGKKKVEEIQFETIEIKKPKIWDKKWQRRSVYIFKKPKGF